MDIPLAVLALALLSVSPPAAAAEAPPAVRDEAGLKAFLDVLDARLESIDTARQLEFYYQLKGLPAPNLRSYQDLHRAFFSEKEAARTLEAWRGKAGDPVLRRRVELYQDVYLDFLYDTFRLARVEPDVVAEFTRLQVALDAEITAFKPLYGGKRVGRSVITDVLRSEPDRAKREEAYLAGREISKALAPRMVRLLEASSKMHKGMGFAGTVEGRLAGGGLSRPQVEAWFAKIEERTREPYRKMVEAAKKDLGVEKIRAWDMQYWVERQQGVPKETYDREKALPRLLSLVRGLGFHPEDMLITVENANLSNAGWNVPIRMGVEARLVVNPFEGKPYYDTLFHEYGHALHEVLIRQDVGTFRTDRPGAWAEGMAEVLAAFVRDPDWQREALGLSPEGVRRGAEVERMRRLLRLRGLLFRNAFEYEAFTDPGGDLPGRYAELMERYLFVPAPPDPAWADDLFLIQPQVYVQNYVAAYMVGAQVLRAMRAKLGPGLVGNPGVAAFLVDKCYRHGASRDWRELLEEAAGAPLGPEAFLEELGVPAGKGERP